MTVARIWLGGGGGGGVQNTGMPVFWQMRAFTDDALFVV